MKKYTYKVYTAGDVYLTNWQDVISEFTYSEEINSPGHELVVTLKRAPEDYGEGTDIDFNYKVRVYCHDAEDNNKLMFYGYITAYTPTYGQDDQVDVTCFSIGSRTNDVMHEQLYTPGYNNINTAPSFIKTITSESYANLDMTATMTTTVLASAIDVLVWQYGADAGTLEYPVTIGLYDDVFGVKYQDVVIPADTKALRVVNIDFGGETYTCGVFRGYLGTPMLMYDATIYGFRFSTNPSDTDVVHIFSGSIDADPNIAVYETYGKTAIPYNSYDPSNILKAVIDEYQVGGGELTYDGSIETTGTTVSYTFNTNTVLEAIQKVIELCPVGWYWYVGADGKVYLKAKSQTPDHYFSLYKDIQQLDIKKKTEDMVNKIYFTGDEASNFYYVYKNQDSIDKYGVKSTRYVDGRVSDPATAETIASAILETRSAPELQATITIMDSNGGDGLGYDIESINVGDVIAIRNVSQTVGLSSWDVARWDEDYWDYNIQNLASINMQVQKITYYPDYVTIEASTIAPDVNKRIEDINRNLEALQTVNNPDTPG